MRICFFNRSSSVKRARLFFSCFSAGGRAPQLDTAFKAAGGGCGDDRAPMRAGAAADAMRRVGAAAG
jgi:hypothetical protein